MSRNHHRLNITDNYIKTELGPWKQCTRRSCKGTMNEVLTRYYDHGPINYEYECTACGKVVKDPRFKRNRSKNWKKWKKKKYNKNKRRKR